ncbi:hypothetical protein GCM10025883_45590 [Mobilicoccus caccae]|uniref:DUF952 domain-containing protein n=2 Tax=Mobilicoccus caccae TaxID=1859295 RepID=A0ABQ6IY87_9MICO|nr:hypothetical protein GCM10025883_00280 [Mobilicoccus caccae]GMA42366.1 hypothetical protein GCM10025883_44110 [Mobilicoccus caccae]GMA42514.1 hypothetical protein GCM10025883_45590 [Mobilicoccus caccae]
MSLLHLAFSRDWNPAAPAYLMSTRGLTIAEVGFLHASTDEDQLRRVARRFYRDVTDPMLVLVISEAVLTRFGLEVRYEPADPATSDVDTELFPHIYGGDLPTAAVVDARPFTAPR